MLTGKIFFVGLGAPRCGTSWMSNYLSSHPEVLMSPVWELRYFKSDSNASRREANRAPTGFIKQIQRSVEKLPKNFRRPKKRAERLEQIDALLDRLRIFGDDGAYLEMLRKRTKSEHRVLGEHSPAYSTLREGGFAAIRKKHDASLKSGFVQHPGMENLL